MHRVLVLALCAAACTVPEPTPVPATDLLLDPTRALYGDWAVEIPASERGRLATLASLVAGRPTDDPSGATPEDRAFLAWAREVLGRPTGDADRAALEAFVRDLDTRRMTIGAGTLTITGDSDTTTATWTAAQSKPGTIDERLVLLLKTPEGAVRHVEIVPRGPDHLSVAPLGKPDLAVRWRRVPTPP